MEDQNYAQINVPVITIIVISGSSIINHHQSSATIIIIIIIISNQGSRNQRWNIFLFMEQMGLLL
jgi:hypothetical protein